jgi:catechol 2,3-dioxygenase-like lactoylglutathione lyase family enzyme
MIGRINHIAIVVPDLDAAAKHWEDSLGAEVSNPQTLPEHGVRIVFVRAANGQVELMVQTHLWRDFYSVIRMAACTISVMRLKISRRRNNRLLLRVVGFLGTVSQKLARMVILFCFCIPKIFRAH